ncbi:putative ABC transporter C family member 15 [Spinacia oleracea]|uniref:ABC-type xenobiotic transporter n=1 Tax=Spinacia oleracea TaxID=3562 RepID=A0A9R0ISI9_SPIOL|nr:putative ABC transporter C family member 15 [Spinacia oleracea]
MSPFDFHEVLEFLSMEVVLEVANVVFCTLFLLWVFVDVSQRFIRREDNVVGKPAKLLRNYGRNSSLYTSVIMSTTYLCYCLYESFWCHKTVSYSSISTAFTWVLSTLILVYSRERILKEHKKWPLVLIIWWVYSMLFYMVLVTYYIITHLTSIDLNIPKAEFVDFLGFPLSLFLCFNGVYGCSYEHELEQPLLPPEQESSTKELSDFRNSGFWSKIAFSWLNPLFRLGRIQQLVLADIPSVPQSETAENASSVLEESLRKQKINGYSLPNAICNSMWKSLLTNAFFAGANTIASYMGPLLITHFVDYLSTKSDNTNYHEGLTLPVIFFIGKCIESISQRQWYFGASCIGIRVRAATIALVYKRSLNIKIFAVGQGNGKIINLINVDAERIGDFFLYIHRIWLLPLQVSLALVILYINLGAAPAIAALSSTIFVMICNTPLASKQEMLHSKIMEAKDSRIKATMETLKSMRVLKLHSWESSFMEKILKLRETEKVWLSKYLYTSSAVAFLFWASPTLVSVVTFSVCILVKTPLTSGTVLSALATFRILQEPIYNLPELISMIAQTRVSVARLESFLRDEDHQMKLLAYRKFRASSLALDIESGEYAWDINNHYARKPTIKISERLKIDKGCKIAVCGSVGSGKSSLLCSILGEIPRILGREIKVYGTKAYVPQNSWIQTGTVRDNVLFGKEMNKGFYEEVLEACALNKDLQMWTDADMCVVGERGINLSGGQKQRIQLARAIYSDADVYFLDDPFSAVDALTGAHLFKKALMQMLSEKTVVYITHQLEFLGAADVVLVMKDGRIIQSGRYEDLIRDSEGELVRQMDAHQKSLEQVDTNDSECNQNSTAKSSSSSVSQDLIEENSSCSIQYDKLAKTNDEEAIRGRVNWNVYSTFITAAYRGALVPVILLCQILFQGLQIGSSYWLAWATEEEDRVSHKRLMTVFVLLSGGSCVFILGRTIFLSTIAIETAQQMFLSMIKSVFRAPISFFDFTPTSRILSRSSTDQSTVDMDIPYRLAGLVFALIQLLSIIFLMSRVAWQIILIFVAVIAISCWYQAYYITTARELARMVGIRKAPILHHFSESMVGSPTIRCFNQEGRFYEKILSLVNDYSRVTFHNIAAMEWLSVRINFLFNVVFFVVLVILVMLPRSAIDPSMSGLAVTYGLNMNVLQAWIIWNLCNVENKMISVERILEFARLPSEAPSVIEHCRPESDWPTEGFIQFENLHVRYSPDLPMVLKGITSTIPAKMKVGVVGRTGSGKSTLIQALFRVVEPSQGRILIDGVDVCMLGLKDLRSRLSIIPQDPTLFQGNVRFNLDPLEEHSDQEIWEVLNKCHGLASVIRQDARLLDAPVAEDGENWSLGQRQLVCLGRVLLQRRRILVLDEATASVDTATDNIIQKTVREETSGCTVITVAHRIPTVIDNDLVLVLDQGKIAEYDSPSELLKDGSTAFSKLVKEFLRRSSKHFDEI